MKTKIKYYNRDKNQWEEKEISIINCCKCPSTADIEVDKNHYCNDCYNQITEDAGDFNFRKLEGSR